MGVMFRKAKDNTTGENVVIKKVSLKTDDLYFRDDEVREREVARRLHVVTRELQLLRRLRHFGHPNVG